MEIELIPNGTITTEKRVDESTEVNFMKGYGARHGQVILLFSGLMMTYAMRVNLSVGIVAMVKNKSNPYFQVFEWDEATRGIILSSFFWGYIILQVPAGILAQRFGAKVVLFLAMLVCSISTLLIPVTASGGWEYMCVSRVAQGLAQGCVFPSVHTLLSKWIHPSERGFLITLAYSGAQIGTVVMLAVSGIIASSIMGWPAIFYLSGGLGLIWTGFWLCFGSNSPAEHKSITKEEQDFIESTPATSNTNRKSIPWKKILTSKPFLALFIVNCTQNWGFWTLLTEIPSYIRGVLDFDIQSNALLSALPYLVMWILSLLLSIFSDFVMNRGYITIGTGRKLFNTIGHWTPMVCLICLGYVTKENPFLAVTLLTVAVGFNAGTYVGYLVNHMDLAPNYAGVLVAITNGLGNFTSIIGPLFVGYVVSDPTDPTLWRIVFFVTAAFFFIGNLIFIIFGKGTIQSWNDEDD